jgi:hypothetical protein
MFAHIAEYRTVFRAMVGKQSGALIQHLFHKIIVDRVRDDVRAMVMPRNKDSVRPGAVVEFLAGGLFGLSMLWAAGMLRMSADEVNVLFRQLAMPALKAAAR